jgi:NitT/TauT family transport system ATP-binding protein
VTTAGIDADTKVGVSISFEHVTKYFAVRGGDRVHALDDVTFSAAPGEFVSIIGPSGCGKSTLLRIVHGLTKLDGGVANVGGEQVSRPSPKCAFVFQGTNLFPWRTARRNVEFGLEMRKVPAAERHERANRLLELTGLSGFENSYPAQLSGGMQQRVGLARALAVEPEALFMDEPFGALDAQTKLLMQAELHRLVREMGKTVLFVTHDMEEAVFLSDRIIVMSARPGKVLADVRVTLPRERTDALRKSPEFAELKDHIWEVLRTQQNEH